MIDMYYKLPIYRKKTDLFYDRHELQITKLPIDHTFTTNKCQNFQLSKKESL